MAYKLIIADHAEELLDEIIHHLLFRLKNSQAATHLLDSLAQIYYRLEDNPFPFALSRELYLNSHSSRNIHSRKYALETVCLPFPSVISRRM